MRAFFDFLRPASWRTRAPSRPERNDAVLARLDDNDPLYRALMDLALQQFESDATLVMESPKQLTEPERLWHAGRASAMGAYMVGVQRWKEGARADEEARRKQRQARKSE